MQAAHSTPAHHCLVRPLRWACTPLRTQVDALPVKQPFPAVQRMGTGLPQAKDNAASAPAYAPRENYPHAPNHALLRQPDSARTDRYGVPVYQ